MGKASLPGQVFALIGVSTVAAAIHSLVVPVDVARDSAGGFTVPGRSAQEGAQTAEAGGGPSSADQPLQDSAIAEHPPEHSPEHRADPDPVSQPQAQARVGEPDSERDSSGKVSLERASELHELAMMGEMIHFLDARLEREYDEGHILGALSMPFTRLGEGDGIDLVMDLATPGDGSLFVIYCTGGDCEASEDTAIRLEQLGYTNIAIMADGYDDWVAAGLPVETP